MVTRSIAHSSRGIGALATVALVAVVVGCAVDRGKYERDVYVCNSRSATADESCGAGWVCYAGNQVGTSDFCAPVCGEPDAGFYCTSDSPDAGVGARLLPCDPSAGTTGGCAANYNCVRTNVTVDAGLCLPVDLCGAQDPCRDPIRQTCLADSLTQHYTGNPHLATTDMTCVQSGCDTYTPCEPGYSCLSGAIPNFPAPDLCVPNCDSQHRCPRSSRCATKTFRDKDLDFCVTGLLGFPCGLDDDCLIGSCVSVGNDTKACSVACSSDADCAPYATKGGKQLGKVATMTFTCVTGQCVTDSSVFMRALCDQSVTGMCAEAAGYQCISAGSISADGGIDGGIAINIDACTRSCKTGADCLPADRAYPALACYFYCVPGYAGTQCEQDDQCLRGLTCLDLGGAAGKRCTSACSADADCAALPWLLTNRTPKCKSSVCTFGL